MCNRIKYSKELFKPRLLVFHGPPHGPKHGHGGAEKKLPTSIENGRGADEGVAIDVKKQKEGPAKRVLESGELFKAANYREDYAYSSFWEHPDKKASWRFLKVKNQMVYRALPEGRRESYLKSHATEIQSRYLVEKDFHENRLSPSLKVPRLRPSLIDQPELLVQNPVYVLGGNVSKGIADNFRGIKADYVPGADPSTVLKNFEEQVVNKVFLAFFFCAQSAGQPNEARKPVIQPFGRQIVLELHDRVILLSDQVNRKCRLLQGLLNLVP